MEKKYKLFNSKQLKIRKYTGKDIVVDISEVIAEENRISEIINEKIIEERSRFLKDVRAIRKT